MTRSDRPSPSARDCWPLAPRSWRSSSRCPWRAPRRPRRPRARCTAPIRPTLTPRPGSRRYRSEIESMQAQLTVAVDKLDQLQAELAQIQSQVAETKARIARAEARYERIRAQLGRARRPGIHRRAGIGPRDLLGRHVYGRSVGPDGVRRRRDPVRRRARAAGRQPQGGVADRGARPARPRGEAAEAGRPDRPRSATRSCTTCPTSARSATRRSRSRSRRWRSTRPWTSSGRTSSSSRRSRPRPRRRPTCSCRPGSSTR